MFVAGLTGETGVALLSTFDPDGLGGVTQAVSKTIVRNIIIVKLCFTLDSLLILSEFNMGEQPAVRYLSTFGALRKELLVLHRGAASLTLSGNKLKTNCCVSLKYLNIDPVYLKAIGWLQVWITVQKAVFFNPYKHYTSFLKINQMGFVNS